MATVNLPVRTLDEDTRQRLIERARSNATSLMVRAPPEAAPAPLAAAAEADAPSAVEAAAARHAAQNACAATAASLSILARGVEEMVMNTHSTGSLDTPTKHAKAGEIRNASRVVRQRINDPAHPEHAQTTNTVQSALLQVASITDDELGTQRTRVWNDLAGDLDLNAAELTPNKWGRRR